MYKIKAEKLASFFNNFSIPMLFLWSLWFLYPLIVSGFVSDDSYVSQVRGMLYFSDIGILDRIAQQVSYELSMGRPHAINWIFLLLYFYLIPSLFAHKIIIFMIIFLNIIFFKKIIEFFSESRKFSIFIAFLIPIFFQFRFWHDPILAFPTIPAVSLSIFVSLYLLIKYLQTNKNLFYYIFLFVFTISIQFYEIYYLTIIFSFLILYFYNKSLKKSFILIALPVAILILSMFLTSYLRFDTPGDYPGHSFNLEIIPIFKAFWIQTFASFPLSWMLSDSFAHSEIKSISYIDFAISLSFSILLVRSLINFQYSFKKYNAIFFLIFSLLLLLAPAAIIAITGHQNEIILAGLGYGYIPVFLQYFGLSVLLAYLIFYLIKKIDSSLIRQFTFIILVILITLIASVTRNENFHVVEKSNQIYKYPRELLKSSLDKGLLKNIESNDLVIRNQNFPSDHYWFYSMNAKKIINTCSLNIDSKFIKGERVKVLPKKTENFMQEILKNKILKVNKLSTGKGYIPEDKYPFCIEYKDWDNIYGLSYFMNLKEQKIQVLLAKLTLDDETIKPYYNFKFKQFAIYDSEADSLSQFDSEILFDFNKTLRLHKSKNINPDEMQSLKLDMVSIHFENFHPEEGIGSYLRWSSGNSKLILINRSNAPQKSIISFTILRPDNTELELFTKYKSQTNTKKILKALEFNMNLILDPGLNEVQIFSNSLKISNGDPRNIVFGISDYKVKILD